MNRKLPMSKSKNTPKEIKPATDPRQPAPATPGFEGKATVPPAENAPAYGSARRKPFNYPAAPEGVKVHRPGTKRATVVATLTGPGATYAEIGAMCGWEARDCYEGIKLIHVRLGYGLAEDPATGRIVAWAAGNEPA